MNTKNLFISLTSIAMLLAGTTTVAAAGSTTPGYGTTPYGATPCTTTPYGSTNGCPTPRLLIDKTVQTPGTQTKGGQTTGGNFVDNLGVLDAKYHAGDTISFKIRVQNTGNTDMSKVEVTDTFPQYLSFTSGVAGTYDKASRTLKYTLSNLKAGASQEVTVMAQAADVNTLPADQGVTCVTNQVAAFDKDSNQGSSDTSSVCIEKSVNPSIPTPKVYETPKVTKTPPTGPEMVVLPILGSFGALGAFIKRKARV